MGRTSASAARCLRTSRSNSWQGAQRSTWARTTPSRGAPARIRQPLADLCAGALAGAASPIQSLAGLENEGLALIATDSEHSRDLLVRVVGEFEQNKRGALIGGQSLNVLDDLAQLLSARE